MIKVDERKTFYMVGGSVSKNCVTQMLMRDIFAVVNSFLLQYRYKRELVTFSGAMAFFEFEDDY